MKIQCDFEQGYIDVWNETDEQWDRYVICNKKEEKKIPEELNKDRYIGTDLSVEDDMFNKINDIIDYLKSKGE